MSKKVIERDTGCDDPVLNDMADAFGSVVESMEASKDHGVLVLGAKFIDAEGEEPEGVQTYINVAGYYGVIGEGLYQELAEQVAAKEMGLFAMIRDVVRDIEDTFEIGRDDELEIGEDDGQTLH